jgi:hypothetical protein
MAFLKKTDIRPGDPAGTFLDANSAKVIRAFRLFRGIHVKGVSRLNCKTSRRHCPATNRSAEGFLSGA